jgi:hypothetical protein
MAVDLQTLESERDVEAAPTFGALDLEVLRHYVINRQGKDFVLYDGLVAGLHAVSKGFFVVDTRLEQIPSAGNGQVAVVSAQVRILDPEQPEVTLRAASGVADAAPENVSRQMVTALLRMAETRAKARALRDLLGVRMVSLEEIGPGGADAEPDAEARPPAFARPVDRSMETIQVEGRTFTRAQVLAVYQDRLEEARRANLQLAPEGSPGGPPSPARAPLAEIVRFSGELKRRLEARAGAARSSGK